MGEPNRTTFTCPACGFENWMQGEIAVAGRFTCVKCQTVLAEDEGMARDREALAEAQLQNARERGHTARFTDLHLRAVGERDSLTAVLSDLVRLKKLKEWAPLVYAKETEAKARAWQAAEDILEKEKDG